MEKPAKYQSNKTKKIIGRIKKSPTRREIQQFISVITVILFLMNLDETHSYLDVISPGMGL